MAKNIESNACTGFRTWLSICSAVVSRMEENSVVFTGNGRECWTSGESGSHKAISL